MKKKILIALFVLVAIVCVFASCGKCEHAEYEQKSVTRGNCKTEGKRVEACKECGEEKVTSLGLGKHDMKFESSVKMTCQEDGKDVYKCAVCGITEDRNLVASKPGKAYGCKDSIEKTVILEATCDTAGKIGDICKLCNKDYTGTQSYEVIPAKGHSYERAGNLTDDQKGISYVWGSCVTDGYVLRKCTECGFESQISREDYAKLPNYDTTIYDKLEKWGDDHGWDYENPSEPVPATCLTPGYVVYRCSNPDCPETKQEVVEDALGHDYNEDENAVLDVDYKILVEATCQTKGIKAFICERCGEYEENRVEIPLKECEFTNLIETKEATCTDAPYKVYQCALDSTCKRTIKQYTGDPLGHDLQKNGEPTCKTEGLTPYKCSRCEYTENLEDEYSDLSIRHKFGSVDTPATCCARAMYQCEICSVVYESYEDDATGDPTGIHVYDVPGDVVEPTCYEEGYTVFGCSAGECGTTEKQNYTRRTEHVFNPAGVDGKIVCTNPFCGAQYRNVSTEKTTGTGSLCFGCGNTPCNCNLTVEWNGYVSPKAPEELKANVMFTKDKVLWTEVEQKEIALELGLGVILFEGQADTTYVVVAYDKEGNVVAEFNVEGAYASVDFYKQEDVAKVEITASTDATVSFYSIVK